MIGGGDIQYIASMHLARNKSDDKLVLVQVDPEYVFTKAERGKPRVVALDHEAFGGCDESTCDESDLGMLHDCGYDAAEGSLHL